MDNRFIPAYPKHFYIASGIGKDTYELVSFDNALLNSGLSNYNLLRVSSILPIGCKQENKVSVKYGSPLLVAYGNISSNVKDSIISSAVSVAIPQSANDIGIIMEYSGYCDKLSAEVEVQKMAEQAMINHNLPIKKILCSSIETYVEDEYATAFSAVALW